VFRAPGHPLRNKKLPVFRRLPLPGRSRCTSKTTPQPTHPSNRPFPPRPHRHQPRKHPPRQPAMPPPLHRRKNHARQRHCVRLCPRAEARPSILPCEPARSPRDLYHRRRVPARFSPDPGSLCRHRHHLRRRPRPAQRCRPPRAPRRCLPNRHLGQPPEHRRHQCPFDRRRVLTWPASRPPVP